MARKPPSKPPTPSDAEPTATGESPASPLDDKFALPVGAAATPVPSTKPPSPTKPDKTKAAAKPVAKDDEEDDDEEDDDTDIEDDDDEDEDLVVFTAREAAGAFGTIYAFTRPFLGNYKKMLAFVGFGVVVETLFNVIMPLSLKFLIDDALGEEDFQALVTILSVLAVAGIFTSIVAVWYERWDAKLAAGIISDVRARLFEHIQNLPS
eukprot:gene57259-78463_t